jgi:hypothetical protein
MRSIKNPDAVDKVSMAAVDRRATFAGHEPPLPQHPRPEVAGHPTAGGKRRGIRPKRFNKSSSIGLAILWMMFVAGLAFADDTQAPPDANTSAGQHDINGWGFQKATAPDPALPRVLLIGDSIVGGYKTEVTALLQGKANVDVWTTPKHVGGPGLNDDLRSILKNGPYDIIHFNESGLHAWQPGRIPDGQYGPYMKSYLAVLKSAAPQAKLIWASTTPVTVQGHPGQLDELDKLISDRNAVCVPLMQGNSIGIDDLHQLMLTHLDLAAGDRWHWNHDGFDLLAKTVADSISSELPH